MNRSWLYLLLALPLFVGCGGNDSIYSPIDIPNETEEETIPPDEELLEFTQAETFHYFWEFAQSESGAARERYHPSDPGFDANTVASGGTGFGLMAMVVAMERNFISRADGLERLGKILDFLENADRYHGAWPHWISGTTGNTIPFSDLDDGADLVETAYLAQGLICVKEYLEDGPEAEQALASQADALWKGVEWNWFTQGEDVLYWHWSPNHGFAINHQLKGYNEVLIAYVLAAASPDHGIEKPVYTNGWASGGAIASANEQYGYPLLVRHSGSQEYGGPLFWAHYSYLGLDPRKLTDEFTNYWEVNTNHSKINYSYCVENPQGYKEYGPDCWGLSASYSRNGDGSLGYSAHSPANDTGVISPTAAISSMPYTPAESMKALRFFYRQRDWLLGPAGFYDSFSPEYGNWVADAYLAIDQGPIVVMIENHRTSLLWELFMQNEEVRQGLDKLGFTYE